MWNTDLLNGSESHRNSEYDTIIFSEARASTLISNFSGTHSSIIRLPDNSTTDYYVHH